jgi:hypothetical protein
MSLKIETSEKAFANLQLLRAPGRHLKATQIIQNIPTASSCDLISPSEGKASHPNKPTASLCY